jgi:imidazolonepropionase-like amidohydrolase
VVIYRPSIVWFLLAASCLGAQNAILLNHANIIDGLSDEPLRDTAVLVENGRIAALAPNFEELPADTVAIDVSGRWLLPGLIDAHVHLTELKAAREMLAGGVTTIRTMGVLHYIDIGIRELHRGGAKDLPDVIASGYALSPNMFMFEPFLLDFPQLASIVQSKVTGTDNVRQLVRANVQHGVNFIKILATERAGTPETDPRRQTFSDTEIAAIVDEATKAGLPVAAHAHGDEGAAAAVRVGARSIEHGSLLSDATLDLMKRRGTYFVPTIAVWDLIRGAPAAPNAGQDFQKRNADLSASAHATALRAWKKGIPLVAGTDTSANRPPPFTVSNEVAEFVKIGIPPMEAIKTATSRAAECLGISNRTGSIRRGYEADLVVIEGDPLRNIEALKKVMLVINDGQISVNRLGR